MPVHINPNDPNCKNAAAKILRRLAKAEQIARESPPSERLLQVTPGKLTHEREHNGIPRRDSTCKANFLPITS